LTDYKDRLTPKNITRIEPGTGPDMPTEIVGTPKLRGFAALKLSNPERMRELAAKGGASLKPHQRSFSRDSDLASRAGAKGGAAGHGGGRPKQSPEQTGHGGGRPRRSEDDK
jgi:general stress protein YciG